MGAKAYSFVGSVYFCLLDANKQRVGGYFKVGNVFPLKLKVETEQKSQISRQLENYGQTLDTLTRLKSVTGNMDIHQWLPKTLAWGLSGGATAMTAEAGSISGTPEEIVAVHDQFVRLVNKKVSDVVVKRKNGVTATAWQATTAITLGDYRIPTAPNEHFYKCTAAGDTGGTEPETWPTDGTTVTDGTVTWQDMGLIIATVNTDYTVNANLGMVEALSTGDIVDGETLQVTYSYAAESGYRVDIATNTLIRVGIMIDGQNEYTLEKIDAEFYSVVLASGTEIGLISEPESDYEKLPFTLTFETPEGMTSPGKINGVPL